MQGLCHKEQQQNGGLNKMAQIMQQVIASYKFN